MLSWLFSDPLPAGAAAPDFALPDESGHMVALSGLRGRNVTLVFYPGDDTPGCTKQLCQFRDQWEKARARGVEIFGVNPQSALKHDRFRQRNTTSRFHCWWMKARRLRGFIMPMD